MDNLIVFIVGAVAVTSVAVSALAAGLRLRAGDVPPQSSKEFATAAARHSARIVDDLERLRRDMAEAGDAIERVEDTIVDRVDRLREEVPPVRHPVRLALKSAGGAELRARARARKSGIQG